MKYDIVKLMARRKIRWKKRWVSGDSGGRLTFRSKKAGRLSDYRIYGNTVDGESVGDKTANICNIIVSNGKIKDELYLTVNDDKSITLNGYANSTAVIHISGFISAGNYYIKGCPAEGSSSSFQIIARDRNNSNIATESGDGVQINATSDFDICIRIAGNYNCDNLTFFPMVSLSESSYEPYGYKVPVTVEGENLWNELYNEDRFLHYVPIKVKNGEFTLSTTTPNAGAPGGSPAANIFFLAGNVNSGASSLSNGCWFTNPKTVQSIDGYVTIAYKATESFGEQCDPWNNKTMLNEGSTPLPYEPYHAPVTTPIYLSEQIKRVGDEAEYVDYAEQKQHRVRKNLLQNTATSQENNGVTFTVNSDGSVTCNGTASATASILLQAQITLNSGSYILTGCPQGGGVNTNYKLDIIDPIASVAVAVDTGSGASLTLRQNMQARIVIYTGQVCENLTFYPMIRKADITDDAYEPYIENTDLDVTLPALPTLPGTNVLSVGTAVQPSRVEVKGRIKAVGQETEPEPETAEAEQE